MALDIPKRKFKEAIFRASGDTVYLSGEIDQENPSGFLNPFFDEVIEQMGSRIKIDIHNLTYMNSIGIKCIIKFIIKRKQNSIIEFIINRDYIWQKVSVNVFKDIDEDNIFLCE